MPAPRRPPEATSERALVSAVEEVTMLLRSTDPLKQLLGTSRVSKLLRAPQKELQWDSDHVIDAVVLAGVVPYLVTFLTAKDNSKLQSEAANALANISAGTSENTCAVIAAGVVCFDTSHLTGSFPEDPSIIVCHINEWLVGKAVNRFGRLLHLYATTLQVPIAATLLDSPNTDLQDHAAWLLANIACENCECVLAAGALPPLLRLLDNTRGITHSEQSLIKTGTWLLSNLCQYSGDFETVRSCLPRLATLIKSTDEAVLKDGCWGLMYICRLSVNAVVESGACEPLTKLLMHTSDEVVCVALEAIGAVFNHGSIEHRRRVVADFNLLPRLRFLLHSKRDRNKEITCTALGALARGAAPLLPLMQESGVLDGLIAVVDRTNPPNDGWSAWREAVRALTDVVDAARIVRPATVEYLVGHGTLLALRDSLPMALRNSFEMTVEAAVGLLEHLIDAGETLAPQSDNQHRGRYCDGYKGGIDTSSSSNFASTEPKYVAREPRQRSVRTGSDSERARTRRQRGAEDSPTEVSRQGLISAEGIHDSDNGSHDKLDGWGTMQWPDGGPGGAATPTQPLAMYIPDVLSNFLAELGLSFDNSTELKKPEAQTVMSSGKNGKFVASTLLQNGIFSPADLAGITEIELRKMNVPKSIARRIVEAVPDMSLAAAAAAAAVVKLPVGIRRLRAASPGNLLRSFILESGIAELLAPEILEQLWRSRHGTNSGRGPPMPMPAYSLELSQQLREAIAGGITPPPSPLGPPPLGQLARVTARQSLRRREIHVLYSQPWMVQQPGTTFSSWKMSRQTTAEQTSAGVLGISKHAITGGLSRGDPDPIEVALAKKATGDRLFILGKHMEAAGEYTAALVAIQDLPIEVLKVTLFLNRSAAYLKLRQLFDVLYDCNAGLALLPRHPGLLQRRAWFFEETQQYAKALHDWSLLRGPAADTAQARLRGMLGTTLPEPTVAKPQRKKVATAEEQPKQLRSRQKQPQPLAPPRLPPEPEPSRALQPRLTGSAAVAAAAASVAHGNTCGLRQDCTGSLGLAGKGKGSRNALLDAMARAYSANDEGEDKEAV